MKQLITLTAFSLLISGYANGQTKSSGVVDIKNVRKTHEPIPVNYYHENLAKHKYHDVDVYRTNDMGEMITGNAYEVHFYRNSSDTLKCYVATYGENQGLNKAAYKWENDTLVSIRLYNSKSKKEIKFKLFGKGNSTGMITDD